MKNLSKAPRELTRVWVFDNDDLRSPYRLVAVYENRRAVQVQKPIPKWIKVGAPIL